MKDVSLYDAPIGSKVIIKKVLTNGSIKRRLLDIGLTPGTVVESSFNNPGGNLTAYFIRGALIAIRDDDAKNILIEGIYL